MKKQVIINHVALPLGVTLIEPQRHIDQRGCLVALQEGSPLPFRPLRTFIINDVPPSGARAQHAESCHEFLLMLNGRCRVEVNDGSNFASLELEHGGPGIHIVPGVWIALSDFSKEAQLLVCASTPYADVKYFSAAQPDLIKRSLESS